MEETYTESYCQSMEIVYGKNIISAGGYEEIDKMFGDENLHKKKILDFGSGRGGVAIYLATKHNIDITGVDILPSMIEHSTQQIPKNTKSSINFRLMKDSYHLPFADNSFDIVFSKEVILHLPVALKVLVLKELYRVLKPGGMLTINDWLSPKNEFWGPQISKLMEDEHLVMHAITPSTYIDLLAETKFKKVTCKELNDSYIKHNMKVIDQLHQADIKKLFLKHFSLEEWKLNVEGYQNILHALQNKSLLICNLTAYKH